MNDFAVVTGDIDPNILDRIQFYIDGQVYSLSELVALVKYERGIRNQLMIELSYARLQLREAGKTE